MTDHLASSVPELIESLEKAVLITGRGRATKKAFKISGKDQYLIGWKFNEWDYGKTKIQMPSHARGLFTLEGQQKIVVRGYDKFFNINEVQRTQWSWLEHNTEGPYYVTCKENGCIILISALQDGTIIVCSKHSYGSREDTNRNHAKAGEEALARQLDSIGVSLKDFALKLYEMNVTAVAEYCDDDFEEHVVEYTKDQAGLYLHGLNLNKPIFETFAISQVEKFSQRYGFKTINYFEETDIEQLKNTLNVSSKTGSFQGKEIEGFVIRCKEKHSRNDYFFKFKFEEPYLMYRQWREVTRTYIAKHLRGEIKFNKHKYITNKYLDFVIPLLDNDEALRAKFQEGHGIIELRKRFLENFGMTASEILNSDKIKEIEAISALDDMKIDGSIKLMLIPIATIGCGKTTIGLTLTGLFADSWAMVNNDDVPNGKNGPTEFVKRGLAHLQTKAVVFMDRNNHQFRERQQIFDFVRRLRDQYLAYDANVQFVALSFVRNDTDSDQLWNLTTQRVNARGDNHQSIKAISDPELVPKIMAGFINRLQPCTPSREPDSFFDHVIDLSVESENSSLSNSKLIVEKLKNKYPTLISDIPSDSELEESFRKSLAFQPTFTKFERMTKKAKHQLSSEPQQPILKKKKPVYFSLEIQNKSEFLSLIESLLSGDDSCLYWKLKTDDRVQNEFHVTCAHVSQSKKREREAGIWKQFIELYQRRGDGSEYLDVLADIRLSKLIWDRKAVTVLVEVINFYDKSTKEHLHYAVANSFPHVTLGTASPEIAPFYSNELAQKAQDNDPSVTVMPWEEDTVLRYVPLKFNF